MAQPIVVTRDTAPGPLNLVGEQITVLAAGAETGSYEIFHQAGPAGSGPPPHNHPWDEAFYVLSGEIAFGIGNESLVAKPGTLVHLPAGTTHWFRFGADGGAMLSMTSRRGAAEMFTEIAQEVDPAAPDIARLGEIGGRHGLAVVLPG